MTPLPAPAPAPSDFLRKHPLGSDIGIVLWPAMQCCSGELHKVTRTEITLINDLGHPIVLPWRAFDPDLVFDVDALPPFLQLLALVGNPECRA